VLIGSWFELVEQTKLKYGILDKDVYNCEHVQRHKSSSPASIVKSINQLKKGVVVMILSAELMRDRITSLKRANEAATKLK
jgi:hypothetical protein